MAEGGIVVQRTFRLTDSSCDWATVDAVNASRQSEPSEAETSSTFPQVSATDQQVHTPPDRFDSRHLHPEVFVDCGDALRRFTEAHSPFGGGPQSVSYTHLRAHETDSYLVCRL